MLKPLVFGFLIYLGFRVLSRLLHIVVHYFANRATSKIFWYVMYYLYKNSYRQVSIRELLESVDAGKTTLSLCLAAMKEDEYLEIENSFDSFGETILFKITPKGTYTFKQYIPKLIAAGWEQELGGNE